MAITIYNNIKRIAAEKKLSFARIESICSLGNGTISKIENGNPTISTIEKIACVLECNVTDLLIEHEETE